MRVDDCYQLGYVIKTHGLKGEVQLFLDVDDSSQYQNLESVFLLQGNSLIPFFLEYIQIRPNKSIAKFDEVDTIDAASKLTASKLYLPTNNLPPLSKGEYYFHDLIGLALIEDGKVIGTVEQVYEIAPQNLISLKYQGKEVMIPINDEIILKVDFDKKEITASLPNGLLEVFLEDDES